MSATAFASEFAPAVTPPPLPHSILGYRYPDKRVAEVAGMVSVPVRELFPDIPPALMSLGDDPMCIRIATERALEGVDLSRIKPGDSVNILCSEHGFAMMGGEAYAQLVRSVKDVVEARTGNHKLRLAFSTAASKYEGREIMEQTKLDEYFGGRVVQFGPYDKGVAIETDIGTLYGVGLAYRADHIIYVHYDDPRETHYHRLNGRALKAFTMSYARFETRSIFHNNFPTACANIVPRALYESAFIQKKFVCAVLLRSAPSGITGVDADNDLIRLDRRITGELLRHYGKMIRLFESLKDCVAVLDGHRWMYYHHAGGLTSCNLFFGPNDYLDLDTDHEWTVSNPAVKAVVVNYGWKSAFTLNNTPFIASHPKTARSLANVGLHTRVEAANNIEEALEKAYEISGTRKVIVFDGSYGSINCTPEMAEELTRLAPEVSRYVNEVKLPKWLAQRGLT